MVPVALDWPTVWAAVVCVVLCTTILWASISLSGVGDGHAGCWVGGVGRGSCWAVLSVSACAVKLVHCHSRVCLRLLGIVVWGGRLTCSVCVMVLLMSSCLSRLLYSAGPLVCLGVVAAGGGCRVGLLDVGVLGAGLKWDVMLGWLLSRRLGWVAPLLCGDVEVTSSELRVEYVDRYSSFCPD